MILQDLQAWKAHKHHIREQPLCEHIRLRFYPAHKVNAVDTTAAGDVYNGAMCAALAEGMELREALRFATKASAISVSREGAQPSIPSREEVDNF